MKKVLRFSLLLFLSVFFLIGNSHAAEPTSGPTTTENGSFTEKTVFGWSETPHAFIQFDVNDLVWDSETGENYLELRWTWIYGGATVVTEPITYYENFPLTPSEVNIWHAYNGWDTIKEGRLGDWTVRTWWGAEGGGGSRDSHFTLNPAVVPEPFSSALFLLGGGMLAVVNYKRRRAKKIKKAALAVVGFLLLSLVCAGSAFAVGPSLEMVDGNGSTTAQPHSATPNYYAEYGWTQQPWLRVTLPSDDFHYTVSWWNHMDGGTPVYYVSTEFSEGVTDVWHSLSNWFTTAREAGDWQIKLDYSTGGTPAGSTPTNFTVTPEPVSSALLLLGGVTLAAFNLRRNRRKA